MSAVQIVEEFLAGKIGGRKAKTEAAWKKLWLSENLDALTPTACALRGGIMADRLPWVFISGYQAAIHKAFPGIPAQGWTAFAATEDQQTSDKFPGTSVSKEKKREYLNGNKSWIAQSRNLDHLLVTVENVCILLAAYQPGLKLSHRKAPGFLGAMSQGFASFNNVPVSEARRFPKNRIRSFARSEAKFVMLASAGFLLAHTGPKPSKLRTDLINLAFSLSAACERSTISPQLMAELDNGQQAYVKAFERSGNWKTIPEWKVDKKLLQMYSARIQKRAAAS